MRHFQIGLLSTLTMTLMACGNKPATDAPDDTGEKPNTPPEISSLSISPVEVYTNDTITATVESSDIDGDTVSLTYVWYVDGVEVAETGNTLDGSTYFDKDQEVTLEVTPTDGTDIGSVVASDTITILNSAPEVTTASIGPAVVYTNDTLTATAEATDADGDPVTLSYAWFVADTLVDETGDSLDGSSYFEKNQDVYVEVTADDSSAAGAGVQSNTVTVSNSTPGVPMIGIDPEEPREGMDDIACVIDEDAIDEDVTDTLSYVFAWTVDGSAWTGNTISTDFPGDTIGAGETVVDEVWECTVSATDGESTSASVSASTTVVPHSSPTLTGAALPGWGQWNSGSLAWSNLISNSSSYGACILNSFVTVSSPFTLSDLQSTGAEVLLVGNPGGGNIQYTTTEMDAIGDFVQAGNGGIVGTYALTYTNSDNGDILEWVGVDSSQVAQDVTSISTTMGVLDVSHPLATGLASSFDAGGYTSAQSVRSTWNAALLTDASIVMQDSSGKAPVIAYEDNVSRGVWVTWMAEYSNTTVDGEQLLYNALVWAAGYAP